MRHTRCSKWHLGSIVYTRNTTNNPQTRSGLCPVAPIKNLDALFKGSTAFWKDGLAKGYEGNRLAELSEFSRLLHLTNNIFLCSRSRSVVAEMNSHQMTARLTTVGKYNVKCLIRRWLTCFCKPYHPASLSLSLHDTHKTHTLLYSRSLERLLEPLPGNQMCLSWDQVEQFMSNLTGLEICMDMLCEVALFTS